MGGSTTVMAAVSRQISFFRSENCWFFFGQKYDFFPKEKYVTPEHFLGGGFKKSCRVKVARAESPHRARLSRCGAEAGPAGAGGEGELRGGGGRARV